MTVVGGAVPQGQGGGIKNDMGGNSSSLNGSTGSMRDVTQIGNPRAMNIPGYQSNNPVAGMSVLGGAVPQGQGGAGSVQTRIDSLSRSDVSNSAPARAASWLQDQYRNLTGYDPNSPPERSVDLGNGGQPILTPGGAAGDFNAVIGQFGHPAVSNGGDGPDWSDPKSVIEWLTSMGLNAAKGAIKPSADFADQLNDATKPSLLDYFDNFQGLDSVKASGDRFMDPEFYKKYDQLQREQLASDVAKNRDAMMRTALSRQAGGGRGMGGDFAGQVMDASNRAITEGNRGIAMDSLQRQLAGSQAGAQMKTQAQGMIYDLMNQGRTDPREILSFIAETAPEILGSAMELIGALKPF